MEVDETSQATEGNPEIPENTGGQPKVVHRRARLDDPVGEDEVEPEAIDEQMRNRTRNSPGFRIDAENRVTKWWRGS